MILRGTLLALFLAAPSAAQLTFARAGTGPRSHHTIVADPATGHAMLCMGRDLSSATHGDLHHWYGDRWRHQVASPGRSWPPPRDRHATAEPRSRDRVILVGGSDALGRPLADVWQWDGASWRSFSSTALAPRYDHAMSAAPAPASGDSVLLYGGDTATGPAGDTWIWRNGSWSRLFPGRDPGPRARHAMAFDEGRGRVVLFGGRNAVSLLGDTWEWDGLTWHHRPAPNGPPARADHELTYDPISSWTILHGGEGANGTLDDTWIWDGTAWTRVAGTHTGGRTSFAMGFDRARRRVVLHGGRDPHRNHTLADTWEWDWNGVGFAWVQKRSGRRPPPRSGAAYAYDEATDRHVLIGGEAPNGSLRGDMWSFSAEEETWTEIPVPELNGHAFQRAALAFYPPTQELLLFGGRDLVNGSPTACRRTLIWNRHAGWRDVTHPNRQSPSARAGHSLCYDAASGTLILFGGTNAAGIDQNDTWDWDGHRWRQRVLPSSPPPRTLHAMACDPGTGNLILHGGWNSSTGRDLADCWVLDRASGTWTQRPWTQPGARFGHGMIANEARGRVLLHAGVRSLMAGESFLDDVYELHAQGWMLVPAVERPRGRRGALLTYDAKRGHAVLSAGRDASAWFEDTWRLFPHVPAGMRSYGSYCASGTTPQLTSRRLPWIDETVWLDLTGAPPMRPGILTLGAGVASLVLPGNCLLLTSSEISTSFRTDPRGAASHLFLAPPLPGAHVYFQSLILEPASPLAIATSNGLDLTFGTR